MNRPTIEPFDTIDAMYREAADAFGQVVLACREAGRPARVALSGGSTPRRLYEMLADRDLPWDRVHWFWGDERNVPPDHQDSNYRMVREALLNPISAAEANVHPVPTTDGEPAEVARAYEQTLRRQFEGDAFPQWDIALLGMGDDAHTASLFPGTGALDQADRWFVENWVEKFDAYRFTLTAPAINSARERWFLVTGSGKRDAVAHVLSGDKEPNRYPAQLISPSRWFVTTDACGHP